VESEGEHLKAAAGAGPVLQSPPPGHGEFAERVVLLQQAGHRQRMHVRLGGNPTGFCLFVIESGGGGMNCGQWELLERHLVEHGLVLSYDRAGIASSDGEKSGVGASEVAERLSGILADVNIEKPFVLIGYSLGGLYARYFAATRPGNVLGLVLLDPTPLSDSDYGRPLTRISVPISIMLIHLMAWGWHLFFRSGLATLLSTSIWRARADDVRKGRFLGDYRHVQTLLKEIRSMGSIQRAAAIQTLPAGLPILCISAAITLKTQKLLQQHHKKLAEEGAPPWSRHQIVDGANHSTLVSNPEYVKTVCGHILSFAKQISAGSSGHSGQLNGHQPRESGIAKQP
jgi:pimeloyl-ACP methyl ester carboxylesterase